MAHAKEKCTSFNQRQKVCQAKSVLALHNTMCTWI